MKLDSVRCLVERVSEEQGTSIRIPRLMHMVDRSQAGSVSVVVQHITKKWRQCQCHDIRPPEKRTINDVGLIRKMPTIQTRQRNRYQLSLNDMILISEKKQMFGPRVMRSNLQWNHCGTSVRPLARLWLRRNEEVYSLNLPECMIRDKKKRVG